MCACADAGTTGAVPKWHYSRTKSTRPRESGTFGYGPYKDEPWSMMSIDKRAYGVRDFYKHVLEGTGTENPGWDSFVVDVLSMLRLVIGYKPTHVPKVSGVHGLRVGTLLTGKPDFVTTTTPRTRRNGSSRREVRAEARRCSRRVR